MRDERLKQRNEGGALNVCRFAASAAALSFVFLGAGSWPAHAQKTWEPVVATVPGGTLTVRSAAEASGLPVMVDPKQFPPPVKAPAPEVSEALPQGAWSPLVTGAIPVPRPASPSVPKTVEVPVPVKAGGVTASEGLSPVRPVRAGVVAAAPADEMQSDAVAVDAGTVAPKLGPLDALPPNASAAEQYCFNTTDTAADARFAWQTKKIQEMEAELNKRAEVLEAKTEEYKKWLARRDEFSRKAHEKLVGFYSRMRADAAAEQLATIDEETAAAVVTKLETKVASQIMAEMDPVRAARIATVIAGAAKTSPSQNRAKRKSAAPPKAREAANARRQPES